MSEEAINERLDRIEKRIEALESIQVTRQEFDALKARVEMLEQEQRRIQRGMAEFIVSI